MLKTLLGASEHVRPKWTRFGRPDMLQIYDSRRCRVSLARRSLPLATGLALGVTAMELVSRYRARRAAVPAFER